MLSCNFLPITAACAFLMGQGVRVHADPVPVILITDLWHPHIEGKIDVFVGNGTAGEGESLHSTTSKHFKQFNKTDMASYPKALTDVTAHLLRASQSWPKPVHPSPAGKYP